MLFHFSSADARAYGTDEAIFLHNIAHWARVNRANRRNCYDGRSWTYNTAKALVDIFDEMWSEDQIRRVINSLVKKKVLLKGNYNREAGRRADDRTLWLALVDETRLDRPDEGAPAPRHEGAASAKNEGAASAKNEGAASAKNEGAASAKNEGAASAKNEGAASAKNEGGARPGPADPAAKSPEAHRAGKTPPAAGLFSPEMGPETGPEPSGEFAGGLPQNRRRPAAKSPEASGEIAGHIKDQILNFRSETSDDKQQQQPPDPPERSPADRGGSAAAAEDSPGGGGDRTGHLGTGTAFPVVPAEEVQKLLDAGCTRVDAEALVGGVPWERITEQIAWLPWRNCDSPRYWLPRYIREGWPKPKGLREHEQAQEAEAKRREAGVSRVEESRRQDVERKARADRRDRFRDGLSEAERGALDREAHDRLLRDGVPGTETAGGFWRDWVSEKGTDGRAYRQALTAVRDGLIDERAGNRPAECEKQAAHV